jgi:hypothetical protein
MPNRTGGGTMTCPAKYPVFGGWMTCDYEDEYKMGCHSSFMHRNKELNKEWPIDDSDKKRWNLLTMRRRGARVTEVKPDQPEEENSGESGSVDSEGTGDQLGGDPGTDDSRDLAPRANDEFPGPDHRPPGDSGTGRKRSRNQRSKPNQDSPMKEDG